MDKTVAALMVAMVASVMAIPLAYLAGRGNAEASLSAVVEEELARSRSVQEGQFAAIRQDLAEASLEQERTANNTRQALWNAGIDVDEDLPSNGSAPTDEAAPMPEITFESFEALAVDTRYEIVVKTFGREGVLKLSMVDESGVVTQQYVWEWTAADGGLGKIDLFFVDGILEDKSYKG